MKQFSFENKHLKLSVIKSSIFVRIPLFIITFLCFALPLSGLIFNLIEDGTIAFFGIIIVGLFSLMGFYMLRISLWNQFGQEIIQFAGDEIFYIADYRWFKDGKKTLSKPVVTYSIKSVGDENKGTLVISNGESEIESVVTMPTQSLEELIKILEKED